MRVVQGAEVEFVERTEKPRGGRFRRKTLLEGTPGTPGNYLLQNAETFGDFVSPRHRHNFDQYRFQIRGTFEFGRDGTMTPGVVAYFPEGTSYGPQTSSEDSLTLVLQFGGASGTGYMSERELIEAVSALKQQGVFKDGVYTRTDPQGGRKNQDAYEACWEYHNGRTLEYPPQRFQAPVFMNPENFDYVEAPDEAGVSTRLLGAFGERRTDIGFLRMQPGAVHAASGARLFYVLSGEGTLENHAFKPESAIELQKGESCEFHARTPSEILFIGLPSLH
jgi:quercetin dioxygenase-like cupin family protein